MLKPEVSHLLTNVLRNRQKLVGLIVEQSRIQDKSGVGLEEFSAANRAVFTKARAKRVEKMHTDVNSLIDYLLFARF